MEDSERDRTEDWLIPADSAPPSLGQLEGRIDEALAVARSAEAAAVVIGEAALEAAAQANRAAVAAERVSTAALEAQREVLGANDAEPGIVRKGVPANGGSGGKPLRDFSERADRLMARLLALAPPPAPDPSTSAAASSRQAVG